MISEEKNEMDTSRFLHVENEVLRYLSGELRAVLEKVDKTWLESAEEIRLRANKPLMLCENGIDCFVGRQGEITEEISKAYIVDQNDIFKSISLMSERSIYAYQDDIKNGFITLKGGHRVGITGKGVIEEGRIKNLKDFSGLNIRLSREVKGCSRKILRYVINNAGFVNNTLIISPPQCGKTTMLRDLACQLSDGIPDLNFKGIKVGIVDERSEIAACFKGIPQYSVGIRTDILDGCPKSEGMVMMVRSMSPDVIMTDEIGNSGDKEAVLSVINAGVKIITTAHGYNITQMKSRQEVLELIDSNIFERFIVLSGARGPGTVEEVIDGNDMSLIYRRM